MVDPSRVRRRITSIELDRNNSDKVQIFIDIFVDRFPRWTLEYSVKRRRFSVYSGTRNVSYTPQRLKTYLVSIMPAEIIATCTAASLGAMNFD